MHTYNGTIFMNGTNFTIGILKAFFSRAQKVYDHLPKIWIFATSLENCLIYFVPLFFCWKNIVA